MQQVFIKTSKDLQEAIDKAKSGDKDILFSIGKYIAYNYYMNLHVKKGSPDDIESEKIYKQFEQDSPDLFKIVEKWVTYNHTK